MFQEILLKFIIRNVYSPSRRTWMVMSRLWRIQTVLYGGVVLKLSRVNPLSPNIHMYILLTVLYIFLMLLVGRIWLNINTFHVW